MKTKMDTSIRIKNETRLRMRESMGKARIQTYDEWINRKLNEEQKDKTK